MAARRPIKIICTHTEFFLLKIVTNSDKIFIILERVSKMNLKASYRYANYLDHLLDIAYDYLVNTSFITTTKQNHLRKKVNNEADDEIVIVPKPYDAEFTPMNVIDFTVKVIAEKEALAEAIAAAKQKAEINIDNAISMNKKKQAFVAVLQNMAQMKTNTKTVPGSDYKFNAEGNQTKYFYNIEETTTIDFDRNDVKALIKKYTGDCDAISEKLDAIEINVTVDFVPKWDVNDTFADVVLAE